MHPGIFNDGTFAMAISHVPVLILGILSAANLHPYGCPVDAACAGMPTTVLHVHSLINCSVCIEQEVDTDAALIKNPLA